MRSGTGSSSASYVGSSTENLSEDNPDSIWNGERTPLLQRTVEGARALGARRYVESENPFQRQDSLMSQEAVNQSWSWQRHLKVGVLTFVCACLVVMLLFLPEAISQSRVLTVSYKNPTVIDIDKEYHHKGRESEKILEVQIKGSFVSPEMTNLVKDKLFVTVKKDGARHLNDSETQIWKLGLIPKELWRFYYLEQTTEKHMFDLKGIDMDQDNVSMIISTTSKRGVAVSVGIQLVSALVDIGILLGGIILIGMYILIIFEVAHRTVVSMLAATTAIAVLGVLDERPSLEEIMTWIDIETVTLLFSMMVMVSILSETGLFNFIGFKAFQVTKGRVWPLMAVLCTVTALVSAVLDNVTTVLLMTPIIIQLCEAIGIDTVRVLMANVIFSNIGGAATAIGDPPNVLIASNPAIQNAGVTFTTFTLHMFGCVVIVALVNFAQLRLMYGKMRNTISWNKDMNDLRHEIAIWHRTAQSMPHVSREEAMVKSAIDAKVQELREELERLEVEAFQNNGTRSSEEYSRNMVKMERECRVTNKALLIKSVVVLTVTVVLFFLQNFPQFHLSLGWTALLGALTLLILSDKLEVESVFSRVEWSTLIFFATLFVVMEALDKLGLLKWIGGSVESVIRLVPPTYQLTVSILLILWVSGLASAFIDNIPFTTMMIPVIVDLSQSPDLKLPLQPLVWSLALGACLGGNGTLIGASANVVCAGVAEQHGYKFTFTQFFKVGFPITIVSLLVASIYLLICHVALSWNGGTVSTSVGIP